MPDVESAVIGAGVVGSATARALARAGREVLLLEQFGVGHRRGSSHGAARIFRLSYPEAHYVRSAVEQGATFREETPVTALRPGDDHVEIDAGGETLRAEVAVVTAGGWARPLLAGIGIDLP